MLVMIMKISDELLHLLQRKSIRIQCEDLWHCQLAFGIGSELIHLSQIHVVDVGPHCLQGYVGGRIVRNDCGDLIDILHAVSTLMESKAPVRHHSGLPDDVAVLPSDVDGARTSKDVEIDDPSDHVVFEILPCGIAVDVEIHTIAIQHEDTVSLTGALAVLEVDRVVSIEVRSRRDQVRISGPQCAGVISRWA